MFAPARTAGQYLAPVIVLLGMSAQAFAASPDQSRANRLPEALRHTAPIRGVERINFTAEAVPVGRLVLPETRPGTAPLESAVMREKIMALTDPKVLHSLPGSPFEQIFAQIKPIAVPPEQMVENKPSGASPPSDLLLASAKN